MCILHLWKPETLFLKAKSFLLNHHHCNSRIRAAVLNQIPSNRLEVWRSLSTATLPCKSDYTCWPFLFTLIFKHVFMRWNTIMKQFWTLLLVARSCMWKKYLVASYCFWVCWKHGLQLEVYLHPNNIVLRKKLYVEISSDLAKILSSFSLHLSFLIPS